MSSYGNVLPKVKMLVDSFFLNRTNVWIRMIVQLWTNYGTIAFPDLHNVLNLSVPSIGLDVTTYHVSVEHTDHLSRAGFDGTWSHYTVLVLAADVRTVASAEDGRRHSSPQAGGRDPYWRDVLSDKEHVTRRDAYQLEHSRAVLHIENRDAQGFVRTWTWWCPSSGIYPDGPSCTCTPREERQRRRATTASPC